MNDLKSLLEQIELCIINTEKTIHNHPEVCENYAEYLEEFLKGWRCNKVVDYYWKKIDTPTLECGYYSQSYYISDGKYHFKVYWYEHGRYYTSPNPSDSFDTIEAFNGGRYKRTAVSKGYVENKQFVKPIFILENNEEIEYE